MDCAGGLEARNYGFKRKINRRNLLDLLCVVMFLAAIAGSLFFHLWVRSQITTAGYKIQKLAAEEESLLRIQRHLKLEEQILQDPRRLDDLARSDLHMIRLQPNQLLAPPSGDIAARGSNMMALAANSKPADGLR